MAIAGAYERLRDLVFPASPQIGITPGWLEAHERMYRKYQTYEYYYSGRIFKELADPKEADDSELKYPLKINLCREWAHMMSGYLFGQWYDTVVGFTVERHRQRSGDVADEEELRCSSMENFLRTQWIQNENDSLADAAAIDSMVFGGTVVKTSWDMHKKQVRDEWLMPDMFIPRWHPTNVNQLLEVVIAYSISRADAMDIWNISPAQATRLPDPVISWERWTDETYQHFIGDINVRGSEVNPYGFIPFTYIPRNRSGGVNFGYYGISTLEDTIALQDEVNARAADIGDGVAYSSHPIRYVVNYTGSEKLEVGPDSLWDLGMGFGGREPKAGTLDVKTNYTEGMDYVRRVEKMGRAAAGLPSIAFGEDEGSQRSGTTLLIRFLPLTQEIRRTRLHWTTGLRSRSRKAMMIAIQNRDDLPGIAFDEKALDRVMIPQFAPILPKDVQDKIDEWGQRIAGGFGTPTEAYEDLGHPDPDRAAGDVLKYQKQMARIEGASKGVQNVGGTGTASGPTPGSNTGQNVKKAETAHDSSGR